MWKRLPCRLKDTQHCRKLIFSVVCFRKIEMQVGKNHYCNENCSRKARKALPPFCWCNVLRPSEHRASSKQIRSSFCDTKLANGLWTIWWFQKAARHCCFYARLAPIIATSWHAEIASMHFAFCAVSQRLFRRFVLDWWLWPIDSHFNAKLLSVKLRCKCLAPCFVVFAYRTRHTNATDGHS